MQLKDFFSKTLVAEIAAELRAVYPPFDAAAFVRDASRGLAALELMQRGRHISAALGKHLPQEFPAAARILIASLGAPLPDGEGNGMAPFKYLPHVMYVQDRGLEHFAEAMAAQRELTRRFSCEFCIRSYLLAHPQRTYAQLERWASDPDLHVRRLVSEGTRTRLPWASRLPAFIADPEPVLRLLERLKDDPALYVRRSVANNLNDLSKDHPARVVEVCGKWLDGGSKERRWIVEHALRTLVKKGDPATLALLGVGAPPRVRLGARRFSSSHPRIGETLRFEVELESQAAQELLVDFRVHFVKANGSVSPKVFKLKRLTLAANETHTLSGRVSFKQHTTRTHYPGKHALELLLNGEATPLGVVTLRGG